MAQSHRLFLYGTLRHPPLVARLLQRTPTMSEAMAPGHRAAPIPGQVYPGLVVDAEAAAPGMVVEVSESELELLDHFEGPLYERQTIEVIQTSDRTPATAGAWLWQGPELDGREVWDLERFVATSAAEFVAAASPDRVHPSRPKAP